MAIKERFVVRSSYHGILLQLVLILVHFVSKDLNILENLWVVVKVCLKQCCNNFCSTIKQEAV